MSGDHSTASKEAVVFILDSYPSMLKPYNAGDVVVKQEYDSDQSAESGNQPTRLYAAKKALESMLFEMIFNSQAGKTVTTTSLVSVIVTKTKATRHHLLPQDDSWESNSIYPNLTELCYDDFQKDLRYAMHFPSAKMVREMWKVQPVETQQEADLLQGDLIDALILGADALYRMTVTQKTKNPRAYRRKIVVLTDAGHDIQLDFQQLLFVIDSLRQQDCALHVLGMGFKHDTVEYETMLDGEAAKPVAIKEEPDTPRSNKRIKRENGEEEEEQEDGLKQDDDQPMPDVVGSEEADHSVVYGTRKDREKLLASIAEKTGGSVAAIHDLQALLDAKGGQRSKKVAGARYHFHVGPGLTVIVRAMKTMQARAGASIKNYFKDSFNDQGEMDQAARVSGYFRRLRKDEEEEMEENGPQTDEQEAKAEMISGIPHVNVDEDEVAEAIRYGNNLIPMDKTERDGLKSDFGFGYEDESIENPEKKSYIHVLGCASPNSVHPRFLIGPPYLLSGKDSLRACTLVAAVARVLYKSNFCAFASLKTSKGKPCLAALFPFEGENTRSKYPTRLLLFKLPFTNDVKSLPFPGFSQFLEADEEDSDSDSDSDSDDSDEEEDNTQAKAKAKEAKDAKLQERKKEIAAKAKASDALVDSLMLDSRTLCCNKIRSPYLMSLNKNLQRRAIDKDATQLVTVQERGVPPDRMMTPPSVVQQAQPAIENFRAVFPLIKKKIKKPGSAKAKKGAPTYKDHLDD